MTKPRNLDDAPIGNCRVAALIDIEPRIVRGCSPSLAPSRVFTRPCAVDVEKGFCGDVGRDLDIRSHRNAFGALSEDRCAATGLLRGNLPHTYSMAGIIDSAMRPSLSWEDAWCRD